MKPDPAAIARQVEQALSEDLGDGDASAGLIAEGRHARARLITRQPGVLAGRDWAEAVFRHLDASIELSWNAADAEPVEAGQTLLEADGPARALLGGERTALNFLQLLSGVATRTRQYVDAVAGTGARILDTRKTLPGLRLAQKYAVTAGGGHNHRLGLHDMIMIKENHIASAGGISVAVEAARRLRPDLSVEVEAETLDQLDEALAAGADRIMLDNFSLEDLASGVKRTRGRAILEASGGIDLTTVRAIAETGIDDISVGELTKTITPLDLSLRFQ